MRPLIPEQILLLKDNFYIIKFLYYQIVCLGLYVRILYIFSSNFTLVMILHCQQTLAGL